MNRFFIVCSLILGVLMLAPSAYAENGRGDRVLFGSNEVVAEDEETGDLVVFGGDLDIQGRVLGDVVSFGGVVTVSGEVTGDLVSMGGGVDLKSTSVVGGNLITLGKVTKEPGARIGGSTKELRAGSEASPTPAPPSTSINRGFNPVLDFFGRLIRIFVVTITLLAVSLLIVLFFPGQVELIKETINLSPLWSAAVGFLTIIVAIFLTPVLAISLVGIPLIPVLWIILTVGVFFGFVSLGQLVGERLFESLRIRRSLPLVTILSGTLLLILLVAVLSGALSSCLGFAAITLISMPGLGAVVLTRFGTTMPKLPR